MHERAGTVCDDRSDDPAAQAPVRRRLPGPRARPHRARRERRVPHRPLRAVGAGVHRPRRPVGGAAGRGVGAARRRAALRARRPAGRRRHTGAPGVLLLRDRPDPGRHLLAARRGGPAGAPDRAHAPAHADRRGGAPAPAARDASRVRHGDPVAAVAGAADPPAAPGGRVPPLDRDHRDLAAGPGPPRRARAPGALDPAAGVVPGVRAAALGARGGVAAGAPLVRDGVEERLHDRRLVRRADDLDRHVGHDIPRRGAGDGMLERPAFSRDERHVGPTLEVPLPVKPEEHLHGRPTQAAFPREETGRKRREEDPSCRSIKRCSTSWSAPNRASR